MVANFEKRELVDGMIKVEYSPHTAEIRDLKSCCNGTLTSAYWFICKYYDVEIESEKVLTEIAKLQELDKSKPDFGCMRWYREETRVNDTNGAFFVLKPLAVAFAMMPEKITDREKEIMLPVFENAIAWFTSACTGHGMYYPNKIVSDGAMLALLAKITENKEAFDTSVDFWERWVSYTNDYGWGWGENTSATYSSVIIDAFNIVNLVYDKNVKIYDEIMKLRKKIINYVDYHEDYEFVPSIRTYNFKGLAENTEKTHRGTAQGSQKTAYETIFADILSENSPAVEKENFTDEVRREKIFGDSYAVTYKGKNIRLGSITRFPVMTASYQNEGHGLAWQSMPVSVLAVKHGVSFLRLSAISDGVFRSHPSVDLHWGRAHTELFEDKNIPEVDTFASQEGNCTAVVRQICHLANKCSNFSDEFYVQNFDGELLQIDNWFVLKYDDCAIAVQPVDREGKIVKEGNNIRIMQTIVDGEEEFRVERFINVCWAIAVFDDISDLENKVRSTVVKKENFVDYRVNHNIIPFTLTCGEAKLEYEQAKLYYHFL